MLSTGPQSQARPLSPAPVLAAGLAGLMAPHAPEFENLARVEMSSLVSLMHEDSQRELQLSLAP